jgi:DNA invertase Pin-like site-specific DNA recombinase
MSTELQLKGDSRRRQIEASQSYAEEHGLELADKDQLEDIGISAFKGANVREGALGQFLEAIKRGSVEPGSYLLIESLDRLSREQILDAALLFLGIVHAGIVLVTLSDRKVYRGKETTVFALFEALLIMSRAHEESQIKSHRVAAAWKNKRSLAASGRPMTRWCPAWLSLSAERNRYEIIPERVAIVQQIFADSASGLGMFSIASRLNKNGVQPFVGPNGWHHTYIAKILANRAVLGEFQAHIRIDGKRVPDGAPIANYFPAIVTDDLFYRAQDAKAQRRKNGRGRKGAGFTNLFSGLVRCAYCGSHVLYENKGSGRKGGTYLICDAAKRQRGCKALRWSYRDFEASFLSFVQELDLESILNESADSERRQTIENEISALRGESSVVELAVEQTYKALTAGGPVDFLTSKLNEHSDKLNELKNRLAEKVSEQHEFNMRGARLHRSKEEIRELVGLLQGAPSEELFKLRAQIASRLKILVQTLLIAPQGAKPAMRKSIEQLRSEAGDEWVKVIAHMEDMAAHPDQSRRYFAVGFRDAAVRAVFPNYNDPLSYEQQIVGKPELGIVTSFGSDNALD